MVIHQRVIRESKHVATMPNTSLRKVSVPSHAARAQTSGKSRMNQLARELSARSLPSSESAHSTPPNSSNLLPIVPAVSISEVDLREQDLAVANEELQRWTSSGLMTDSLEIEEFDLVLFWNVSTLARFPLVRQSNTTLRARNMNSPSFTALPLMSFLFRHPLYHASELSRQARKPMPTDDLGLGTT
jgi:hypothetical protein